MERDFFPLKGSKQSDFKYLESLRLIDFSYVRWGKSYSGPYRENLLRIWVQGRCAGWCGLDYRNIKCTRGMSWSMRHASPAELRMRIRGLIIIYWHEFFQNMVAFRKPVHCFTSLNSFCSELKNKSLTGVCRLLLCQLAKTHWSQATKT